MSKQLDFIVSADGSVALEASGYQGKECDAASERFIRALNADVLSKTYKPTVAKAIQEQRLEQNGG